MIHASKQTSFWKTANILEPPLMIGTNIPLSGRYCILSYNLVHELEEKS